MRTRSPPSAAPSWAESLPVLSALLFHAWVHQRWALCIPAGLAVWIAHRTNVSLPHSPLRLILSAAFGATAAALSNPVWPLVSPLPPMLMSPLCGALVGLAAYCQIARRHTYAIHYALLLIALSAAVQGSVSVYLALAGLGLILMATAYFRGALGRTGAVGLWGFAAFILLNAAASFGIWHLVRASGAALTEAILHTTQGESESPTALPTELTLERHARAQDSDRLLLEIGGDPPQRLRARVYDLFDGVSWRTSPALEAVELPLLPPGKEETLLSTELTLWESLFPHLPTPAGTRFIESLSPRMVGGEVVRGKIQPGVPLRLLRGQREQLPPEPTPDSSLTSLPLGLRAELLPWALKITQGAQTPAERARAVEEWFSAKHRYSLSTDLSGRGSALAVLIRERRPASCVYFASAMAALLRSLDIPARVVGGFVPQERNPFSDLLLVRERDAHAWVEVYLPDQSRFVAYDPTPWQSRESLLAPESTGTLSWFLQALSSRLKREAPQMRRGLEALLTSPLAWAVGAIGALGLTAGFLIRRRRSRPKGWDLPQQGTSRRLQLLYSRYLRALHRGAGVVPAPAETDEEVLRRLAGLGYPRGVAIAEDFVARYRLLRYRKATAGPALDPLVDGLEEALRQESKSHPT